MAATSMRPSTLAALGLPGVLEFFRNGRLPVETGELVDRVFGEAGDRGALVISGANGIVGAGKAMQLGSRLEPYGVPVVALDFPGSPDGIGKQYPGLVAAFGREGAGRIASNIVRLAYDGKRLPASLGKYNPRFLLEAIPEILEIKKAHYRIFRAAFPEIEIRSVTSGFPSSQLGVGIAHPAFPHEINKVFEVVESEPSAVTQLLWALGLQPLAVSDDWSFVLDVLFCGLMLAALRYHRASNMPFWKIDKYVRRLLGPNPFRAHDVIGAAGANFLTWSCLQHLSKHYGDVFSPTPELEEHKTSGENWYPLNHFRPVVNWTLDKAEEEELDVWVLGPLLQMTSLLLHEKRAHPSVINAVGELCAQFRRGMLAVLRGEGPEAAQRRVEAYHALHPAAAQAAWHPEALSAGGDPAFAQLYVNAEHDGKVGVITLGRESYNQDVDAELNRAIDWLKAQRIERVILSGDFHLALQLVGADTNEFFPALEKDEIGFTIAASWSKTARRLNDEFKTSVGVINGKRCLGGMLELMNHCHFVLAAEDASLGMPEATLPVVPGMEGCHWPFRRAKTGDLKKLFDLVLTGKPVKAKEAQGWLVDFAGPINAVLKKAWTLASGGDAGIAQRPLEKGAVKGIAEAAAGAPAGNAGGKAILECVQASCACALGEALEKQARHSAGFMTSKACRKGVIGSICEKTMSV